MKKLSSERLVDTHLLGNTVRRSMPHVLVAFLCVFFTLSVPLMMELPNPETWHYNAEQLLARQQSCVRMAMGINLLFLFALGIYFGVHTMSYTMRRRSAYFWHALPQKRSTLYFTNVSASLLCAALGGFVGTISALIVLCTKGADALCGYFFLYAVQNLIWFLVAYAITVFSGSFSGSGIIQVLVSLTIVFYPIAVYGAALILRGLYSSSFAQSYYYNLPFVQWLCPVYYAAVHFEDGMSVLPTVVALFAVAMLLLGGLWIYCRRAIENTEKPIVFVKLGNVLKYLLIFVITIYAGLFFEAIADGWIFFGFVSGGVLAFLLGNTILAKSPKAMLRGWRGFLIYAVAFALFFTVWSADVFRTIERVPDADRVTSAEVRIGSIDMDTEITDRETLEALCTLLENQIAADREGGNDLRGDNVGFYIETVLHTKWGIPVARNYYVRKTTAGAQDFLRAYADSGVLEVLFTCGETLAAADAYVSSAQITIGETYAKTDFAFADFWKIYRREFGAMRYERLSASAIGMVSIWDMEAEGSRTFYDMHWSLWSTLPIYADMHDTEAFLRDAVAMRGEFFTTDGDLIIGATVLYTGGGRLDGAVVNKAVEMGEAAESYSATGGSAIRVGADTSFYYDYPAIELTAVEAEALLPHLARGYASISSIFLDIDTEYYVILRTAYPADEETNEKNDIKSTEQRTYRNFIAGSVPESVKTRFK